MRFPNSFLIAILIAAILMADGQDSRDPRHHFMMYKNPPKPTLALLPVQSKRLERPAKVMFNQALAKEAVNLACCRIVPLPDGVRLDSAGQVLPKTLPELKNQFGVDLILQSKLEHAAEKNELFAEIIDTKSGDIRSSFHQECQCPVGELISWMVPEAVRKLSVTMRMQTPRCRDGMVLIPASVIPGSREPDSLGRAWGSGNFCIDMYEHPNVAGNEPTLGKTWKQAAELCAENGKRLCTEAEWELACSGHDRGVEGSGLEYPYGNDYDKNRCNTQSQTIQLSGGNPGCQSSYGVFDLSGNVYEWTSSPWSKKFKDKVVKGGNWNSGAENSKCHARFAEPADTASQAIGFRCCSNAKK